MSTRNNKTTGYSPSEFKNTTRELPPTIDSLPSQSLHTLYYSMSVIGESHNDDTSVSNLLVQSSFLLSKYAKKLLSFWKSKAFVNKIMDQQAFGAYLVVNILSKNLNNTDKYGCIPKSWVKVKDYYDNTVVFGYPSEDRIDTKLRVIEYQPLDTSWPTIFGEVVFHTDSQEDAFRFLATTTDHESKTQDQSKNTSDTAVKLPTIKPIDQPKRKRGRPRKRKLSVQEAMPLNEINADKLDKELELQILEAEKIIRTYASDFDDEVVVISSTPKSSHSVKTPETSQIFPSEPGDALEDTPVNKQIAKKITLRPRRKSTRRTRNLSDGYQGFSNENCDGSDDSDYTPENVRPEHARTSGHSIPSLDQEINRNLLNDEIYSECYNFYVELKDSYQKNISIRDNADARYCLQNIIYAHKDNVAATAKQPSPSSTSPQPDAINPNMFSHPQPLLQERYTSSISEKDTRWTVRYPKPGSGIIELMPDTGVYVSKKGLKKCQSKYKETTKFTRALLEEVFTDEALRKCSFTGVSRRKYLKNTPKPGLDPNARETFFDYVLKYSLNMGWEKADPEIIMSCIKNRLQTLSRIG